MTPKEGTAVAVGGLLVAAIVGAFLLGRNPFAAGGDHRLDAADDGTVVEVVVGEQILLRLEGNPTTGYEWQVDAGDPAVLALAGEPDYESSSDDDGSGGTYTFRFEAVGRGSAEVVLQYYRPWLAPAEVPVTFTFTAVVAEPG